MKKLILATVLAFTVSTQAGVLDFFDFTKFFEAAMTLGEGLAENLEKVRLKQRETADIKEQWESTCEAVQTINPTLVEFNKFLTSFNLSQNYCLPLTNAIKLQSDLLMRCKDYYNRPVPANAEYLVGKFALSIVQSKMIMSKCFPILKEIKLPGLPGGN